MMINANSMKSFIMFSFKIQRQYMNFINIETILKSISYDRVKKAYLILTCNLHRNPDIGHADMGLLIQNTHSHLYYNLGL